MSRDTALPPGFSTSIASDYFLFLHRDGVRIGVYGRDLPLLEELLAKVAREHQKRYSGEEWERRTT